ncbi:fungal-specific transcription factor domain-containing protein [Mortierella sp. GBAus27b]|nr:hypothetical protein BGX31_002223 [Mortierella sp. GBA43]KAI8361304.1 fungal-specific transcription factor domain-containing protein [Mortierella sp. GBAus27b]
MTKIKPRLIARISCQECRRRKTRCNFDGQSQKCSTCARIGTPCVFAQKNGVVLDINKVMEENNPHLFHQRDHRVKDRAKFSSATSPPSASAPFTRPPLAPASSISLFSSSSPIPSYIANQYIQNRPSRSNSTSSAAVQNDRSSPTEDLSSVMDRLQIDAFGIAPHTLRSFSQVAGDNDSAETSASEWSDVDSPEATGAKESTEQDENASVPTANKRHSSGSTVGTPRQRHRSSRSRSVPLVDIQLDLIELYFKHVHPFLLVLHKPSFFRRLYDPKDPVPDFLLAAMYAAASHYAPGREEDGRRYLQFWLSRLDDTLDKPRLSTVQALLIIIKYQEGVKQPGFYFRTYMYTQMVIVLARELQLHKTTPVNAKLDPENHEIRRRLFWTIFVLDQFLAVSQGRTTSFREVEPEADLPRTDTEDPNDIEEIELIENAVEYIKLVKIDHQALILTRKFLTKVITPEETIPQGLFLHQALMEWKNNLPTRLHLSSTMSPHTPFVGMLHILYHACTIMIQRCYCEDPSVSHLEIASTARENCSVSATSITIIADDLYTNYGMVAMTYPIRGCYFIIYCLIASATIQVNNIRRGLCGPIMFKRSLALLGNFLRQSTAVDIEREIELLKNSMDTSEGSPVPSSASTYQADYRPPLKPILPMSQKYGAKNYGGSSIIPIRPRKVTSPKTSSLSPSGIPPSGTLSEMLTGDGASATATSETGIKDQSVPSSTASKESSQSPRIEDDLEVGIKSSPSPAVKSISFKESNNISETTSQNSDTFLRSVPTFTAPASLPSDFNAFAQAQQQAIAANGGNQPPPAFMSIAQFLAYQQEHQRIQLQKQQMSASQIQEQFRLLQQRQMMQLQQEQLQQLQQNPAVLSTFLNNFSNLNSYQQLNSDQAQNELLTMLNSSTMFNYGDQINGFGLGTNSALFPQPQQQQTSTLSQTEQDALSASLSPSSTTMSSAFSPDLEHNQLQLGSNFFFPSLSTPSQTQTQEKDGQRTGSLDESLLGDAALSRNPLHDTPSPESFALLDMTGSFPSYIGTDNTVPFGVRQALGDVGEILKFQAQAGLADE